MTDKKQLTRSAIATALVVVMLVAVPFVLTQIDGAGTPNEDSTPMLTFDGMQLVIHDDGSIQTLVDVYVENIAKTRAFNFYLEYNEEWLTPSDIDTNQVVIDEDDDGTLDDEHDDFFRYNYELFPVTDESGNYISPFLDTITESSSSGNLGVPTTTTKYYRSIIAGENTVSVSLELSNDILNAQSDWVNGKIGYVRKDDPAGEGVVASQATYYLDDGSTAAANIAIKLGTLSFRVASYDALRAMMEEVELLGKDTLYWYLPELTVPETSTIPFYANQDLNTKEDDFKYTWKITYWDEGNTQNFTQKTVDIPGYDDDSDNVDGAAKFIYDFGGEIISAEPLQKEITINAYQAYNYPGTDRQTAYDNLAIALGKYSPTIVANYADSKVKNFTINWGAENVSDPANPANDRVYDYTIYIRATYTEEEFAEFIADPSTLPDDCILHTEPDTGVVSVWREMPDNHVYDPKQGEYIASQYLYYRTEDGNVVRYPAPMQVHINVVPVTAIGISADGLEKQYTVNSAAGMADINGLLLPGEVRIRTDIISGAPSLYLTIGGEGEDLPAWTPANQSPTGIGMGSIFKDGANPTDSADAHEHWPTTAENTDTDLSATEGIGDYTFVLDGHPKILRTDMTTKYPWLTAPEGYDFAAKRTVVDGALEEYVFKYVSTVALDYSNRNDVYYTADDLELVLAVAHTGVGDAETGFAPDADFRIRLPNGDELDEDYFTGAVAGSSWVEANYTGDFDGTNRTLAMSIVLRPGVIDDNATDYPKARAQLKELRRWINLGGYFEIAVHENGVWSDFYPVYVEPRVNLYEEDKVYNFIGLNAGLINYHGSIGDTVTLPRGEYYPVSILENEPVLDENGDPVLDSSGNATYYRPNTHKTVAEDYGVLITYDPVTGMQPGRTYTFTVEHSLTANGMQDIWNTENPDTTITDDAMLQFGDASITRFNADGSNDFFRMKYSTVVVDDNSNTNPTDDVYGHVYDENYYDNGTIYNAIPNSAKTFVDGRRNSNDASQILHEPVLRVEENESDTPIESVRLIYEGENVLNVITQLSTDGLYQEVEEVVFNTQTEGYTVRQSFVLTLLNDGTVDIDGIYIDSLTDLLDNTTDGSNPYNPTGGNFEITDPPASFLAAGSKTTFTITYTYNLAGGEDQDDLAASALEYLDKLYVCSTAHPVSDYLCEFDARFSVTPKQVNRVTVVVLPPFLDESTDDPTDVFYLGEAGVITGPNDYTYASSTRMAGEQVYIGVFPYEEYEVQLVYWNGEGQLTSVEKYDPNDDSVYNFMMPARNVTVYVVFYEPTMSKLRPNDINVYAAATPEDTADRALRATTEEILWQKSFTNDEMNDAATGATTEAAKNRNLMQGGAAAKQGYDASTRHYLVVLDKEEAYVQADTILRKVVAASSKAVLNDYARNALKEAGYDTVVDSDNNLIGKDLYDSYENLDIAPIDIQMLVYSSDENGDADLDAPVTVYSSDDPNLGDDQYLDGYLDGNKSHTGSTADETKHTSTVFDAPIEGERKWLVITLQYIDSVTNIREYYIEIVRRPSHSVTMNYGNSPVGMIYNTEEFVGVNTDGETILSADGQTAYDLFVDTRSFAGHEKLPYAFTRENAVLKKADGYSYNREAWIPYGMLYDPDSQTYTGSYSEENDLDLDPYAMFVILGEDFDDPGLAEIRDSSMREIELKRVRRYIEGVVLLDQTATTEVGRFNGTTGTVVIDLGTLADDELIMSEDGWQATHYYTPYTYTYGGVQYEVYAVDGKKVTLPDGSIDEENMYFLFDGMFVSLDSLHTELTDPDTIADLEVVMEDTPTPVDIRPGVYTLVYEFDDFDAVENTSANPDPLRETRKIVVLGPVGDTDADGDAHNDATAAGTSTHPTSDEALIENRVSDPLGYEAGFDGANAFKFRTVDANNDRNINNIDANELHSNHAAVSNMWCYDPTGYKTPKTATTSGEVSR